MNNGVAAHLVSVKQGGFVDEQNEILVGLVGRLVD